MIKNNDKKNELAFMKDMPTIMNLLNEGAPLSQFHIPGKTDILLETIVNKNIVMFNNLLERGFDIESGEFLYLHHAIRTKELRYVKEIINRISNLCYLNKIDPVSGDNALHVATKLMVDNTIILELSTHGVEWNIQNDVGQTPLHHLLRNYIILDKVIVDELINKKANFDCKDKMGISPNDILYSFSLNNEWKQDNSSKYLLASLEQLKSK